MPNANKLFTSAVLAYEGLIDEDCDSEIIQEHHIDLSVEHKSIGNKSDSGVLVLEYKM